MDLDHLRWILDGSVLYLFIYFLISRVYKNSFRAPERAVIPGKSFGIF